MNANYIIHLEKALLSDEVRHSKERLSELIHDDFIEISQSGKTYGKQDVLDILPNTQTQHTADGFQARLLTKNLWQVTYKTTSTDEGDIQKTALRTSLWKLDDSKTQIIFHQGTQA